MHSNFAPAKWTLWLQALVLSLLDPAVYALFMERIMTTLRQLFQIFGLAGAVANAAVEEQGRACQLLDFLAPFCVQFLVL